MNMISARVPSDCISCGDEDNKSHDATLSHIVIKLRLCFFVWFEYAPSSGDNLNIAPLNDHPYSINSRSLLFLETTIMGKTADLAMVQKTIIDTLNKECKWQKVITERGGCSQSAALKHIKCKVDWKE